MHQCETDELTKSTHLPLAVKDETAMVMVRVQNYPRPRLLLAIPPVAAVTFLSIRSTGSNSSSSSQVCRVAFAAQRLLDLLPPALLLKLLESVHGRGDVHQAVVAMQHLSVCIPSAAWS